MCLGNNQKKGFFDFLLQLNKSKRKEKLSTFRVWIEIENTYLGVGTENNGQSKQNDVMSNMSPSKCCLLVWFDDKLLV